MASGKGTDTKTSAEDFKDHPFKQSKFEYDLYHEEDDKVEKIIRVKRFNLPSKGERWKIFEDNKILFIVEGDKLSKKEKEYLRTADGFNFLIKQCKGGIKSFNALKIALKKVS